MFELLVKGLIVYHLMWPQIIHVYYCFNLQVGEFVKHGSNKAVIELEIYKSPKNVTIRREIIKQGNKTSWSLNGNRCTMSDVKEKVKSLNIQIGNLCQFLPQVSV